MDRRYELEILRRSLAMLTPGAPALRREDALRILGELATAEARLERLLADLRRLVEDE